VRRRDAEHRGEASRGPEEGEQHEQHERCSDGSTSVIGRQAPDFPSI
jgi:hypothetical protein